MKIQLNQTEIENALKNYVTHLGFDLAGREITFDFTAGRGVSRITADLDISDDAFDAPPFDTAEPEPKVEDPSVGKEMVKPVVAKRTVKVEPETTEPQKEENSTLSALSTAEDPASVSLFSQ